MRWSSRIGQREVLLSAAHDCQKLADGQPVIREKSTPAFKAECVRQVAVGARQTVARAQGILPALLGRWQRAALEQVVPSSAEREEINRLRAELKRMEIERDILNKAVTIFAQPQP